jgi:hypothetical protein
MLPVRQFCFCTSYCDLASSDYERPLLHCVQRLTEVAAVQAMTQRRMFVPLQRCALWAVVCGWCWGPVDRQRYRTDSDTGQTAIPDRQRYLTDSDTGQTAIPDRQRYLTDSDTGQTAIPERQQYLTDSDTGQTAIPDRQRYRTDSDT